MIQLILHGIGDYLLQTDTQATNKKKPGWYGFKNCLFHCITYSIPFLFIGSWMAVLIIFLTHFAIDRSNFIAYLIAVKNGTKRYDGNNVEYDIRNFGFHKDRPFALSIWLYIIVDNLFHIICNYIALKYL